MKRDVTRRNTDRIDPGRGAGSRVRPWAAAASLSFAFAATTLAFGCREDLPTVQPCTNIPEGGCPRSRGVACEDPVCEAVYLCFPDNHWELETLCPAREAGPDRYVPDSAPPQLDASSVPDAPDGAFGGEGCGPLQSPDCPAGLALGCPNGCCGCEELFVCQNKAWVSWGVCGDAGVVPNKR
jgi:hypothetical protein